MESITHIENDKCFILDNDGAQAVLKYQLGNDAQGRKTIDFSSTFVAPELRGKGLAEKLVRVGINWAKEQGYILTASCWYAAKFID